MFRSTSHSHSASEQEQTENKSNTKLRAIETEVAKLSNGRLKVTNFFSRDALFQVRGFTRPIPLKVRSASSSLCLSGVYLYDTTKLPDNRLYLFLGPESPAGLRIHGDKVFELMISE
jgi:hypothetical protein